MIPVAVAFGVTSVVALVSLAVGVWVGYEWAAVTAAGRAWPDGRDEWQQVDDGGADWPNGCYGRRE